MADVGFRVLGPAEVTVDDDRVDVGGPQLQAALALLVAGAGHVVSVAALMDGLWGQHTPPHAARTVRTYVSRLRKALAVDLIATRRPGYVLLAAPDAIDAVRFERLATAGRRALKGGAPAIAHDQLVAALGLWRGAAYGEFEDIPALRAKGLRLERLRLDAVQDRIDTDLAAGLGRELVAELEDLTGTHPRHERLWGQLMTALYRASRQADALETFRRAGRALAEDSGVAPAAALTEIHRQVLAQDPRLLARRGRSQRPGARGSARSS